jgi:hypothetical protein
MEITTNLNGDKIVTIQNEDGTTWSGLKSAYDEQQAALSTPIVSSNE